MKRRDEYIVGHPNRGIVAAVAVHEVAKAIACQLYHEHPKSAAYVTHRGKTWHYAGEWSAALTPNTARTVA